MARYEYGEYIGTTAVLRLGISAFIRDADGKILLTQRTDNARWCLPGGAVEAGESAEEACAREVLEETGLVVQIHKLIGIYSTPHRITVYNDGNRVHLVALSFEAVITGGTLGTSNETTAAGYFTEAEIAVMDIIDPHRERIADALAGHAAAFIK